MAGRGQAHQLKQFLGGRGFKASASWTGCPGSRRSEQRNPLSGLRQPWWPMKVLIPLFTPVATLTSMIHAVHRSLPALLLLPAFKTGERRQAADRAAPFLGNRSGASSSSTTFIVYGYRYYTPELGRWLSRDPIGVRGGVNLYCMMGNESIGKIDRFGMEGALPPPIMGPPNPNTWFVEFSVHVEVQFELRWDADPCCLGITCPSYVSGHAVLQKEFVSSGFELLDDETLFLGTTEVAALEDARQQLTGDLATCCVEVSNRIERTTQIKYQPYK